MSITPIYGWGNSSVPGPTQPELQGVSFWPRAAARLIDVGVHFLVAFFTGMLFMLMLVVASGGHIPPFILIRLKHTRVMRFLFAVLGIVAYQVILTTVHGSTLGKIALSMVVVQEDGSPCQLKGALIRELGYFVDALFLGIVGYTAMGATTQAQRYGDQWAHTVVCERSSLAPEKLRGMGRFAVALLFALIADAGLIMTGMVARIAR